jgi:hypothetical protein
MYSPKRFLGQTKEFGDFAILLDDRPRDSSTRHAIDAWESEGGSAASLGGFGLVQTVLAQTALADAAGWQANNNAGWLANNCGDTSAKDGAPMLSFADEEDRILRRLGAAVIMRWNTIPTKLQRELFDNASSVGDLLQTGALKGQIARFLHKHKDGAG